MTKRISSDQIKPLNPLDVTVGQRVFVLPMWQFGVVRGPGKEEPKWEICLDDDTVGEWANLGTVEPPTFYWVYLPEIDEAGMVVEAESFEDAFRKGCHGLCPDEGVEVQVHELGESRSFTAEESMIDD